MDVAPPEFLRLTGHPLRWRLLAELARSDRTVQELTGAVGEAQNLVSYHLGKLRKAGLASPRRSSADGRDSYYAADLTRIRALFSATAGALHPGLLRPLLTGAAAGGDPATVLFLCTGNSSRSQMAEALVRHLSGGVVKARSAGSHPKPLHPNAVRVMKAEHDIDMSGQQPKHVSVFADDHFDRVITLCDRVREACPEFAERPESIHWSIPDPAVGRADYRAFQATAAELVTRIEFLLAALIDDAPAA